MPLIQLFDPLFPKRNAAFDKIRAENASNDDCPNVGIRSFCPTRWTVRGNALESIAENYDALNRLMESMPRNEVRCRCERKNYRCTNANETVQLPL